MGNQQSISSNNLNDNVNDQMVFNNNKQNHNFVTKESKIFNLNEIKYTPNTSSVFGDKSEMSNSDIMMKETNESIKSIDDTNIKLEFSNAVNNQREINNSNLYSVIQNSNQNKNIFIKIVWNEGGSNVFISGNFVNWNQWFYMVKKNQHFEIVFVIILYSKHFDIVISMKLISFIIN